MAGKRDTARIALQRSAGFLAPQHHDQILDSLQAEGLLDEPRNAENGGKLRAAADDNAPKKRGLLTPLQASQAKGGASKDLLRSVQARAARLGYHFDINDQYVDIRAFDVAAKSSKDTLEKMAIKATLFKLGLIAA
jgi:hypothetical protein